MSKFFPEEILEISDCCRVQFFLRFFVNSQNVENVVSNMRTIRQGETFHIIARTLWICPIMFE